jgi:hypothetical protein
MNKFNLALTLAMDAHEGQIRKGTANKLGRDDVLWYYRRLSEIFRKRDVAPAMTYIKK